MKKWLALALLLAAPAFGQTTNVFATKTYVDGKVAATASKDYVDAAVAGVSVDGKVIKPASVETDIVKVGATVPAPAQSSGSISATKLLGADIAQTTGWNTVIPFYLDTTANPIFIPGIESSVLMDGSRARMWYRRGTAVVWYTTSTDPNLRTWTTPVATSGMTGQYPYVFRVGAMLYMALRNPSNGNMYLWKSNISDGVTWTAANGGNPILVPSATANDCNSTIYNPSLKVVGSTAYLLQECKPANLSTQFNLMASTAPWNPDSLDFAPNMVLVKSDAGAPELQYSATDDAFISIFADYTQSGYVRLRAMTVPLASYLTPSAWKLSPNFLVTRPGIIQSDPYLLDTTSDGSNAFAAPLMLQWNFDQTGVLGTTLQNTLFQAWSPLTMHEFYAALTSTDKVTLGQVEFLGTPATPTIAQSLSLNQSGAGVWISNLSNSNSGTNANVQTLSTNSTDSSSQILTLQSGGQVRWKWRGNGTAQVYNSAGDGAVTLDSSAGSGQFRSIHFPDATGTLALTSQLTGAQSFTATPASSGAVVTIANTDSSVGANTQALVVTGISTETTSNLAYFQSGGIAREKLRADGKRFFYNATGDGAAVVTSSAAAGQFRNIFFPDAAGTLVVTGGDINTSNQVTATHLSAPLPVAQGGTGQSIAGSYGLRVCEQHTDQAVTGDTNLHTVFTCALPALGANSVVEVNFIVSGQATMTGNTTPSMTLGASTVFTWPASLTGSKNYRLRVTITNRGAANAQFLTADGATGNWTSSVTTSAVDTATSKNLTIGITNAQGADTATLRYAYVVIYP